MTAGLLFWYPIEKAQRAHIQHITSFAAHSVKTDIADEIHALLLAQVGLAESCSLGKNLSKQQWHSCATPFLEEHPGYLALLLTDNAYRVQASLAAPDAEPYLDALFAADGPLKKTAEVNLYNKGLKITPGLLAQNGRSGHGVLVRIRPRDDDSRFLIAVFDDEKVLEEALADHAGQGYGLAIFEGNRRLYGLPSSASESETRWSEELEFPVSRFTWRIRVWPQLELLGKVEPRLPNFAFITGAAIGMLLSLTLISASSAYVKSKALSQARDKLESRVQKRTAELHFVNAKLKAEIFDRKAAEQSLQVLSGRLLQLRDEEQRRLARDLHDSTGQLIRALAVNLERVQAAVLIGNIKKAQVLLAQTSDLADRASSDLRTISHLLHPPILDDLGLNDALSWYATDFSGTSGIPVALEIQPELGRFQRDIELTIFRILQEGLTNIYKHSGSATAEIKLSLYEDQLTLQISDHGCGIPSAILAPGNLSRAKVGIGIAGMRERVRQLRGELKIQSDSSGTHIQVMLPIDSSLHPGDQQENIPEARWGITVTTN
jgi:signal transduction histidine kinase